MFSVERQSEGRRLIVNPLCIARMLCKKTLESEANNKSNHLSSKSE